MIDFLLEQEPESVTARGQSVLQRGIEDVVFLTLRFATGQMAHVHLSWLNPRKERRLTLVLAEDGRVRRRHARQAADLRPRLRPAAEFADFAEYLTLRDGDVYIPKVPMDEPLRLELGAFLDCIDARTQPVSDLAARRAGDPHARGGAALAGAGWRAGPARRHRLQAAAGRSRPMNPAAQRGD